MKRVLTAVALIPVVLITVFGAPTWFFALVVWLVALVALREYLKIVHAYGLKPLWKSSLLALTFAFAVVTTNVAILAGPPLTVTLFVEPPRITLGVLAWITAPFWFVVASAFLFLIASFSDEDFHLSLPSAACSYFGILYVGLPLLFLVLARSYLLGPFVVFWGLVLVWVGDTFAYCAGMLFGRHRMASRISPGKTWEGAVASFVGTVVVGSLLLRFQYQLVHSYPFLASYPDYGVVGDAGATVHWWFAIASSAALNIAAQLGDLAESLLKRGANVKDSGSILPGHGGLLDRIDGLLFATPIVWYIALISS